MEGIIFFDFIMEFWDFKNFYDVDLNRIGYFKNFLVVGNLDL